MKAWLNFDILFILFAPVFAAIDVPLNLYIGSGGEGYGAGSIPPGVQIPFGMMRLSPDTSYDNTAVEFHHYGGYHYGKSRPYTYLKGAFTAQLLSICLAAPRLNAMGRTLPLPDQLLSLVR